MVDPAASISVVARPRAASAAHGGHFSISLSELNPLQYIPVIGTIYRAITHDTIPETARIAGSLVVSGLTGGPIGVALNLGMTAIEKLAGLDPEKIGQSLVTAMVHPHHITPYLQAPPPPAKLAAQAFSPAQLAAYGVQTTPDGSIRHGVLTGSDVLNDLELSRLA